MHNCKYKTKNPTKIVKLDKIKSFFDNFSLNTLPIKSKKSKYTGIKKPKPYTAKQENDVFLGKVLCWGFIMFYPAVALGMYRNEKARWLVLGIFSLLFALYHLMGLIFKWDHTRVCARHIAKATYQFDIKNAWSEEDTKNIIFLISFFSIFGVFGLIFSIFDL